MITGLNRRAFLMRSGAVLSAATLAGAARSYASLLDTQDSPGGDWEWVRRQFNTEPGLVHLAGFFLATHPAPVRAAIERYRRQLDANPIRCWLEIHEDRDAAMAAAAADYLHVPGEDVAFTDSTTMGLGLVYTGLRLEPGDEVLTSDHDHYATHCSLEFAAQRTSAKLVYAPLYRRSLHASTDEIVDSVMTRVTPRTRIMALTWVHSKTGLRLPVRAIADALEPINAGRDDQQRILLCIDGVHGLGAVAGNPAEMGCDVFIAGTHKWLFGPRGTGLVWAAPHAWPRIAATIPPFGPHEPPGSLHTPGGFHSFEHRWAVVEAFAFHKQIGRQRVYERIAHLDNRIKHALADMRHITLHTPLDDELSAGIICFEVDGLTPDQAVDRLAQRRIVASRSPYDPTYVRLAAGLLNSEADVDAAITAVASLA